MTIYGYGKMQHITFSDLGKIHVFYGENEAGKSTIMSFVHSILFGFPLKNQIENRYEPKDSSTYGGKLTLITKDYGEVTIQRVKGKATGDVTITFSDGRIGKEEDLKNILRGIDKATYQSIFSFDLEGLNHLHKLNENDISRYLLSAGVLGSGGLLETERFLQKQSDELFKPTGKNPVINNMLMATKGHYEQLKVAEKEQNQYEMLQSSLKDAQVETEMIQKQLVTLEQELTSSYNYKAIEPILLEEQRLQNKLIQLQNIAVTADAEERFEQLKQAMLPIETQLSSLLQQQTIVEERENSIKINTTVLQEREAIRQALDQTAFLETFKQEYHDLQQAIQEKEDQIQQLRDFVHLSVEEELILKLDTSVTMKERVASLHKASEKLLHDKQYLDERQAHEEQELKSLEHRISYLKQHLLKDEQREKFEKQVNTNRNQQQQVMELQFVEQAISTLEKRIASANRTERRNRQNSSVIFSSIIILSVISSIASIFFGEYLLTLILLLICIITFYFKRKNSTASFIPDLQQELADLHQRRDGLRKVNEFAPDGEVQILLQRDVETRQQLQNAKMKKEEHEIAFHKIVDAFEMWEQDMVRVKQQTLAILEEWRMPQQLISSEMLVSIYTGMSELKQHIYDKRHLIEKVQACQNKMISLENKIFHYANEMGIAVGKSIQEMIMLVRNELLEAERAALEKEQLVETKNGLANQVSDLSLQKQHLEEKIGQLYARAGCTEEVDFVQMLAKAKEKREYEEKLGLVQIQLSPYKEERQKWIDSPQIMNEYHIQTLEERIMELEKRREELRQQIVTDQHRIKLLEDGGTYDEHAFQFAIKKAELDTEARNWMKYTLAKVMLQKAVNVYKDKKFPEILQKAEEHLSFITDGEYKKIQWDHVEQGMILQRKDGLVFEAKEVSRGTQEAVYVSLRLALAQQLFAHDGMIIIIDDSFVNFDHHRVQKVVQLLQKVKLTNQIIFFTCHEHLLPLFEANDVTVLT